MKNFISAKTEKFLQEEQGFTLIETLVATAITIFGLVMYVVVAANVAKQNANVGHASTAITLAQDKIEDIKNSRMTVTGGGASSHEELIYFVQTSPTTIASLASPVWDTVNEIWIASSGDTVDAEEATGTSKAFYTRTWTITPATNIASATNLTDIEITVSWDNATRSKTLTTRVSQ